jgi:hypothetical protein
MEHLGVAVLSHLPAGKDGRRPTARSKGKVERPFRAVKKRMRPSIISTSPRPRRRPIAGSSATSPNTMPSSTARKRTRGSRTG